MSYDIFFHLTPGLDAIKTLGGNSVLIKISKNKSMIFFVENENLSVEKSIFLGGNKILNNLCMRISGKIMKKKKLLIGALKKYLTMNLKIKNALISVSDKEKLSSILKVLKKHKINIISSGGTYNAIRKLGYKCIELSKYTGFKEMLDGRVKTLHPKIHAGILHDRKNKIHKNEMSRQKFPALDLIIVNFYPFQKVVIETKNPKKLLKTSTLVDLH